jgi:hypothetical protein
MTASNHKGASHGLFKQPRFALAAAMALIVPALFTSCGGSDPSDPIYTGANSVFVHNGDVFVAGYIDPWKWAPTPAAALWKNGRIMYKSEPANELDGKWASEGFSVFVADTGVYMAGALRPLSCAALWKNGAVQPLEQQPSQCAADSSAFAVFVSGGDVYVAGAGPQWAVLWKNGEAQYLTDGNDYAEARSVFVSEGDVYAVGRDTA